MFDFSFGEIGVVAVIALLVLGPERLPKVARTAGALVRRARTSWQSVRDEIERELAAEDMKRGLQEARQAAADLRNEFASTQAEIKSHADSVMESVKPPIAETVTAEGGATGADIISAEPVRESEPLAVPMPAVEPIKLTEAASPNSVDEAVKPLSADPRDAR